MLAFHIVQIFDAAVSAGNHYRIITGGAVQLNSRDDWLDCFWILDINSRVSGCAQFGKIQSAANQTFDHTGIIGSREQFDRHTQQFFKTGDQALIVGQTVGFVFATQNANAEFLDCMAVSHQRCRSSNGNSCCF